MYKKQTEESSSSSPWYSTAFSFHAVLPQAALTPWSQVLDSSHVPRAPCVQGTRAPRGPPVPLVKLSGQGKCFLLVPPSRSSHRLLRQRPPSSVPSNKFPLKNIFTPRAFLFPWQGYGPRVVKPFFFFLVTFFFLILFFKLEYKCFTLLC